MLTWWQGRQLGGYGSGVDEIYDAAYRKVARVRASGGLHADMHDFTLTSHGTALITVFQPYRADLRRYGGPKDGVVVDGIVQEIDIKTGLLELQWDSLDHVSPAESYASRPRPAPAQWDYFHINSVQEAADGDLVVSARHMWTVYKISRASGRVVWRLGGKRSDFELGRGATTAWQHDARLHPDGTVTIFDNAADGTHHPFRKRSRALTLRLDPVHRTATVVSALQDPRRLLAHSQGSLERLPGGEEFVGYGSRRWFAEYSPAGELLLYGRFAAGNTSYRTYQFPWSGRPAGLPWVAARAVGRGFDVSASWNGATGVARWQLLAGPGAEGMTAIAAAPATGFETTIPAVTARSYVAMRALDAAGNVLTTSAPVKLPR